MERLPLILITLFAPFAAFAVSLVFLMRRPKLAQGVVLAGGAASVVCAGALLAMGPAEPLRFLWFASGDVALRFGFLFDGLSLWFGAVVALITFLIQVYSLGYMAHDPARTRFFAMLGLFGWAMMSYVYAVDLLQAFIFWELVGLASFFLIGFWYEKPSASAAAKKAFVMTRIGDVGLFIGLLMILNVTGIQDIPALLDPESGLAAGVSQGRLTTITLLLFFGIMGKSAQFPLHTWLPDAMEGPTPVSALLHSATMVAAGVFLFARLFPLFEASGTTLFVVLCIATFTALLSSTVAMVETDIKKVLAYSSISQLGFMLMALAAGGLLAGVFHLITHAIFKALLFLCAGSYIHHCGSNELEAIGRHGGRRMKLTTTGLLVGALGLAGVPPLAGFFSKEEIFATLSHHGSWVFLGGAYLAAAMTAYYTFRMVFLVVRPATIDAAGHGDGHHAADSPATMTGPILVLSLLTVGFGFLGGRLAESLGLEIAHHTLAGMAPAVGVVILGIVAAWLDFGRAGASRLGFIRHAPPLEALFRNKWYVDAFHQAVFARATAAAAGLMALLETRGLDAGFDKLGEGVVGAGGRTARAQAGWVQLYVGCSVVMLGALALYLGLH
jgi:NADH-quinone oxidoreductase subunit L